MITGTRLMLRVTYSACFVKITQLKAIRTKNAEALPKHNTQHYRSLLHIMHRYYLYVIVLICLKMLQFSAS
jgi:hypothetical protein